VRDWMKEKQGDFIVEQIAASGIEDYIRIDAVRAMLAQHRAGKGDYARRIWTIYVFALWHKTYLDDIQLPSMAGAV